MSFRESVLSDRETLRTSLYLAGALGLALIATWPRGPLEAALRTGAASDTFTVVSVCFLLALIYLGAWWGREDTTAGTAAEGASARLHEYVKLTPVSLLSLVVGRLTVGALHTVLLLLLGTPFLVAAMAVGGAGIADVVIALAIIGAASLAARMGGLFALALFGQRRPLRELFLFVILASALGWTFFFAPAVNPFSVLAALLKPAGAGRPPAWSWCLLADLGAAALFAASALAVLAGVRARAGRRNRDGAAGDAHA